MKDRKKSQIYHLNPTNHGISSVFRPKTAYFPLAVAALFLVGCGGGGGGESSSNPPPPISPTANYIVYGVSNNAIFLVDSTDATKKKTITGNFVSYQITLESATVNETTGKIDNPKKDALLVSENGELKLLPLKILPTGADPAWVKVSNESAASSTCFGKDPSPFAGFSQSVVANDYTTPGNSRIVYVLPGQDGICATQDDVIKAIRANMGEAEAPVIVPAFDEITPLWDSKGSPIGWLVFHGKTVLRYDPNFATSEVVVTDNTLIGLDFGNVRNLGGFGYGTTDYRYYNAVNKTLSAPITVNMAPFTAGAYYGASDETHVFYHANDSSKLGIYRRSIDGTEAGTQIALDSVEQGGFPGQVLGATANHVVFENGKTKLKSVPKIGGSVRTIADNFEWLGRAGSRAPFVALDNNMVIYERYRDAAPDAKFDVVVYDVEADKQIRLIDDANIVGEVVAAERPGTPESLRVLVVITNPGTVYGLDFSTDDAVRIGNIPPLEPDEDMVIERGSSDANAIATRYIGDTVTGIYLFDFKAQTITKLD